MWGCPAPGRSRQELSLVLCRRQQPPLRAGLGLGTQNSLEWAGPHRGQWSPGLRMEIGGHPSLPLRPRQGCCRLWTWPYSPQGCPQPSAALAGCSYGLQAHKPASPYTGKGLVPRMPSLAPVGQPQGRMPEVTPHPVPSGSDTVAAGLQGRRGAWGGQTRGRGWGWDLQEMKKPWNTEEPGLNPGGCGPSPAPAPSPPPRAPGPWGLVLRKTGERGGGLLGPSVPYKRLHGDAPSLPPASPSLEPLDGCVSTDSELIKSYLSSAVDTELSRLACSGMRVFLRVCGKWCAYTPVYAHPCPPLPFSPRTPPPPATTDPAWLGAPAWQGWCGGGG